MTPKIRMPIVRQLPRDPDAPLLSRLRLWREPVVYEVVEEYGYTLRDMDGTFWPLTIPPGFRSDLASAPRMLWALGFRPDGMMLVPGLFHDFAYRHGYVLCGLDEHLHVCRMDVSTKWRADMMLALIAARVSGLYFPALAAFLALSVFGWPAWWANAKYRRAAQTTGEYQLHGEYDDGTT